MWSLTKGETVKWTTSLNDHRGRQVWQFELPKDTQDEQHVANCNAARQHFESSSNNHSADQLLRLQLLRKNPLPNLPSQIKLDAYGKITKAAVYTTLQRALCFYSKIQSEDGHWPGGFCGSMFMLPGLIISLHITRAMDTVLSAEHYREICRYLFNHQNQDGGWGLHSQGTSTMFGTALNYIALRLLGISRTHKTMKEAQSWILEHGGATQIPSWGKFWLAVLGVYEWAGVNPLPPEMYLLPEFAPLHPGRMWCHCRLVYLPMSYLYGLRFSSELTETTKALRGELYNTAFEKIDWNAARDACAKEDLHFRKTFVQRVLWTTLHNIVEPVLMTWPGSLLRKKALTTTLEHIHYEDESTSYLCLGPVNKVINMLCCWVENPASEAFKKHLARIHDHLWIAEDGMTMPGTSGSLGYCSVS